MEAFQRSKPVATLGGDHYTYRKRTSTPRKKNISKWFKSWFWRLTAITLIVQVSAAYLLFEVFLDSKQDFGLPTSYSKIQGASILRLPKQAHSDPKTKEQTTSRIQVVKRPTPPPPKTNVNNGLTEQNNNIATEPIIIRFRDNMQRHHLEDVPCDIPCQVWPPGSATTKNPATVDGTDIVFEIYSMEGPVIYPFLSIPPIEKQKNNTFYATTSFLSDIPLPYYSPHLYDIQATPVDFDTVIKGASFIANNCNSYSHREEIVDQLMNFTDLRIDSLSQCLRNADPPNGLSMKNKATIMQQYLFHLAFENQVNDDYITEKLWGTLASGTLPVYLGPKNIREHIPPNSAILVDDFASIQDLARHLVEVSRNKTLYESYHTWRTQPLPVFFQKKYGFTKVHSYCRMCRLVHAKLNGLIWDKEAQEVLGIGYNYDVDADADQSLLHTRLQPQTQQQVE